MSLARSLGFTPFGPTFEDDEGGPSRYWRNDPMRNPEPGSDQAQGSALFNKG